MRIWLDSFLKEIVATGSVEVEGEKYSEFYKAMGKRIKVNVGDQVYEATPSRVGILLPPGSNQQEWTVYLSNPELAKPG